MGIAEVNLAVREAVTLFDIEKNEAKANCETYIESILI